MMAGITYDAYPNSWKDSSERNAPTRPTKFAGGCDAPVVKNHTGSVASWVTSAISQIRASAKSATPTNSLMRRDKVDSGTSDLHQHGQHEGPPARPFLEESPQLDAKFFRHEALVRTLLDAGRLDALGD